MKRFLLLTLILAEMTLAGQGLVSLNGTWKVTWADGSHGAKSKAGLAAQRPGVDPFKYRDAVVPGELHAVFEAEGLLDPPYTGMNTLYANWVADQYYQYYTEFELPVEASGKEEWLVFEQLDLVADIYLNGEKVGGHQNAFYPCRVNVTDHARPGTNELVVLLESGLYSVAEKEGEKYGFQRGIQQAVDKRHYLRKPQSQFNWDWNPRYINVGITGDVALEWAAEVRLDQVSVTQELSADLMLASIRINHFLEGVKEGVPVEIAVTVEETGQRVERSFTLSRGLQSCGIAIKMKDPELWWPAGQGEQHLYTLVSSISTGGKPVTTERKRIGIRRVEVDQSPHPDTGSFFTVKINNRPVFMKGANWIPPELVYSKIDRNRLDTLVNLALGAHFNMLRIWGGGTWAGKDLLELCDERGIVIWHDFLFACSVYPGDDDEFYDNVRSEVTWGVREFSHHPSIIVWGGNNENEMIYWDGERDKRPMADYVIYTHLIPLVLHQEGINVFYVPTSPHSEGKYNPKDPYRGDQHPWGVGFWAEERHDFWDYRNYVDRFANEGGVMGATSPASIRQMTGEGQYFMRSFAWDHHDNLLNFQWNELGNTYQTFELFFGTPAHQVEMEDYLLGSALLQAEAQPEYINNFRRRMYSSSAAVFWMYTDSWPVTHGWTIVDYYLRKKLSYHPVRRAFQPVSVVVAREQDSVFVFGVNDSPEAFEGSLRFGLFSFDGKDTRKEEATVRLPANSSTRIGAFPLHEWEQMGTEKSAAFAELFGGDALVARHRLLLTRFGQLELAKPRIKVTRDGDQAVFSSDRFVWGATIDRDGDLPVRDNCFDLYPGVPYRMYWPPDKKLPVVTHTGNQLVNNLHKKN